VLTTTPGGAAVVVDPVDVDAVDVDPVEVDPVEVDAVDVGSAGGVDASDDSAELSVCGLVADSDDDCGEGDDGESAAGVSAHASRGPVRSTAPTPSATARDPTRPTYAAAII
jgi:hypothetical protein